MATTTGNEYDHITISDGTNQTVHYLKDTVAREDISELNTAMATKADSSGAYPDLTSGSSDQLLSTTGVTDKVPYTFRQSGGNGADREIDKIVGGTVCWNQYMQIQSSSKSASSNNVTYTDNRDGTYTVSTSGSASADTNIIIQAMAYKANHVYACFGCPPGGSTSTYFFFNGGIEEYGSGILYKRSSDANANVRIYVKSGTTIGTPIKFSPLITDLTAMFGSTVADYIYALETATAGAGIALLKSWGFFTKPYYAYNAGELMSVNAARHETVGFNQWDEETNQGYYSGINGTFIPYSEQLASKNAIRVMPGTTYYYACISTDSHYGDVMYYDANMSYISWEQSKKNRTFTTPENCHYIQINLGNNYGSTYNHDICINISNTVLNGTYQPYVKHTYALDSDLTLRGIPKLDSNNRLYYDGDTYASDGTVTRRYKLITGASFTLHNTSSAGYKTYRYRSAETEYAATLGYNMSSNITNNVVDTIDSSSVSTTCIQKIADGLRTIFVSLSPTENIADLELIYELATPTTETADPFQNPQILDPYGTEEYVDAGVIAETRDVSIPVGHETFYPENLRAKIEGLPFNFATLIAPTETSYKATQAYSSGALFIVNNILYKATASIANGATITPGTNCTATTLAAVIAALA